MAKRIFFALLFVFIIIQFFRPSRNEAGQAPSPNDISTRFATSNDVKQVLDKSCNDCHSNNTRYPWYFAIQPVAWWLDHHIREGKRDLNFNEFATYRARRQYHKMEEVEDQVTENHMPLYSYTLLHKESRLSERQKEILVSWSRLVRDSMEAVYPPDSLKAK